LGAGTQFQRTWATLLQNLRQNAPIVGRLRHRNDILEEDVGQLLVAHVSHGTQNMVAPHNWQTEEQLLHFYGLELLHRTIRTDDQHDLTIGAV
jgi:hypothetical protein